MALEKIAYGMLMLALARGVHETYRKCYRHKIRRVHETYLKLTPHKIRGVHDHMPLILRSFRNGGS